MKRPQYQVPLRRVPNANSQPREHASELVSKAQTESRSHQEQAWLEGAPYLQWGRAKQGWVTAAQSEDPVCVCSGLNEKGRGRVEREREKKASNQ